LKSKNFQIGTFGTGVTARPSSVTRLCTITDQWGGEARRTPDRRGGYLWRVDRVRLDPQAIAELLTLGRLHPPDNTGSARINDLPAVPWDVTLH
jgi:hypothetical protein